MCLTQKAASHLFFINQSHNLQRMAWLNKPCSNSWLYPKVHLQELLSLSISVLMNKQKLSAWKLHFVRIVLTVCQSALLLCHRGHLKANSWFPHSQGFVECSRKFTSSIKWIFVLRTDYTDFGGTFLFIYNLFTDPENNETHWTNSIALGSPWEYPTALISKCEVTASLFKACEVLKKNSSNCIKFMFIKL